MNTASKLSCAVAALGAVIFLSACSLDRLTQGLNPQPAKTIIAAPAPQSQGLTSVYVSGNTEAQQTLSTALSNQGYSVKNDPTLAVFHITTSPSQGISEESTSAPLIGILRKNTRTETYEIPFIIKDAAGNQLHSGNVVGFGDEDAGIYPRATTSNTTSTSKAKSEALAQLPDAIIQVLPNLPWRVQVVGMQDTKTVMLGLDTDSGIKVDQHFSVVGKPDTVLKITGFGPYGRALATAEKGPLPTTGQLVEPKP